MEKTSRHIDVSLVLSILDCEDPSEITGLLQTSPTSIYIRGSRALVPIVLPKRNAWHYRIDKKQGQEFDECVGVFLKKFGNREQELISIAAFSEVKVTIIIQNKICFRLPSELVEFTNKLDMPFFIDRY